MGLSSIYLDANVFIEVVESPDRSGFLLLHKLHREGHRLVTSDLTYAEIITKPIANRLGELVALYERLLFEGDLVTSIAVDRAVLRLSAEVRAWLGGKLPDTIHVATAVVAECNIVVSADQRLRMPHGLKRVSLPELMQGNSAT